MIERLSSRRSGSTNGQGGASAPPVFNAPAPVLHLAGFLIFCHVALLLAPQDLKVLINWYGSVTPKWLFHSNGDPILKAASFITHMLLHDGWIHLLMNSIWLIAFGAPVARKFGVADRYGDNPAGLRAFWLLFVASGVIGALTFVVLNVGQSVNLLGASGGVFGLLGGLIRIAFAPPNSFSSITDKPVIAWSVGIIVISLVTGIFGIGMLSGGAGVAWESHIGGYMFGLLTFPQFLRWARAN